MSLVTVLRIVFVVWAAWHLGFGVLSTFAPQTGAAVTGWTPEAGWTADLVAMSTQYGMVMMLLGLMFLIMAFDPVRLVALVWVAVAEQVLGIAYGAYLTVTVGQPTPGQLAVQAIANILVMAVLITLWRLVRQRTAAPASA